MKRGHSEANIGAYGILNILVVCSEVSVIYLNHWSQKSKDQKSKIQKQRSK